MTKTMPLPTEEQHTQSPQRKFILSAKQILRVMLCLIALIISFTVSRLQSLTVQSAIQQIAASSREALAFFSLTLDEMTGYLDQDFYQLLSTDINVYLLETMQDEVGVFRAKSEISKSLRNIFESTDLLDSVFLYSPAGTYADFCLYGSSPRSAQVRASMEEQILDLCDYAQEGGKLPSSRWMICSTETGDYLLRIVKVSNTYCGGYLRVASLQNRMDRIFQDESRSGAIYSGDGVQLTRSAGFPDQIAADAWNGSQKPGSPAGSRTVTAGRNGLVFSIHPENLDLIFALSVSREATERLSFSHLSGLGGIFALLALMLLILYGCFVLMQRPYIYLSSSMKIITDGHLDFRIRRHSRIRETEDVYHTFNQMLDEVEHLRLQIYEEALEREKITRQFLQTQLKSHFIINSLNIIYSLAQTQKNDLIQELTFCLVQYFRYLSSQKSDLVTIGRELEHARNYMKIQSMRFPDRIGFTCSVEEDLLDYSIPFLILQTFLENAVRYGWNEDGESQISLSIERITSGQDEYIRITVSDIGPGYPENILRWNHQEQNCAAAEEFPKEMPDKADADMSTLSGLHADRPSDHGGIGIINIHERLRLLYGSRQQMTLSNQVPSGAQAVICIPAISTLQKEQVNR